MSDKSETILNCLNAIRAELDPRLIEENALRSIGKGSLEERCFLNGMEKAMDLIREYRDSEPDTLPISMPSIVLFEDCDSCGMENHPDDPECLYCGEDL